MKNKSIMQLDFKIAFNEYTLQLCNADSFLPISNYKDALILERDLMSREIIRIFLTRVNYLSFKARYSKWRRVGGGYCLLIQAARYM